MAEIEDDIDLQYADANRMSQLYDNFKKEPTASRTKGFLLAKRKAIEEHWLQFKANHECIFRKVPRGERGGNKYLSGDCFNEVYKIQSRMLVRIEEWLQPILATESAEMSAQAGQIVPQAPLRQRESRLPHIKIENFSGDYHKWMAFKSIFTSMIHSKDDIPAIEKFHYLLSFLSGEAARVVNHYALTADNYTSAWNELLGRYDNERAVVDSLIMQLLGIPVLLKESGAKLRDLLNIAKECVNSLHNWGIDTSSWDPILVVILVSKFDADTRRLWEASLATPKKLQSLNSLYNFIDNRFLALENQQKHLPKEIFQSSSNSTAPARSGYVNPFNKPNVAKNPRSHQTFLTQTKVCDLCKGPHVLKTCSEFQAADAKKKASIIRRLSRCVNCFGKHNVSNCTGSTNCSKCHKRHNILLHFENSTSSTDTAATPSAGQSSSATVTSHFTGGIASQVQVLLATALVKVLSTDGSLHTLRCLVDPGSQSSFITKEAAQFLRLKKKAVIAPITGLGSVNAETATNIVEFTIGSRYDEEFHLLVQALVLTSITSQLPTSRIPNSGWEHIRRIELADPTYDRTGKIDVLLGADAGPHIMLNGLLHGGPGEPMAQNTKLGWILSGQVAASSEMATISSCHVRAFHLRADVDVQLRRFWELEELSPSRAWSAEETACEQMFVDTHSRDWNTGRYTVSLPFKHEAKPLGMSRFQALSRLFQLEKKLLKKDEYGRKYREVIQEYVTMQHMELIQKPKEVITGFYLPHHAVIKESSSTTKLRVVFDASARSTSGESLNDQLLVGPTLQEDLISILIRWRSHRIVISADVEKMYRQVRVREADTYYQKMLWRANADAPVQEYRLKTLTFGTASAAYLAIRTLRQLAVDESKNFVDASKVTLRDFYVDDLLSGASTVKSAMELQQQLVQMLAAGGFQLRKWISNCTTLLSKIPEADREVQLPLPIDMSDATKTLGILYHPSTDTFQFKISLELTDKPPTKRSLLSESAKLFDPLGWLAPVVIRAKIMFQSLWKIGLSWDQQLGKELQEKWLEYRGTLVELEKVIIPRWIGWTEINQRIELHVFCDASEAAYAAVIYSKIVSSCGAVKVTLLAAKTKVAPIKAVSLPRLELCGAVLASRLLQRTKKSLDIDAHSYAWTDSTIVLAWLSGQPSRWKTFVANRVAEVQENLERRQWRHVRSEDNPADCASRGLGPAQIKDHPLWWSGPPFLLLDETQWPRVVDDLDTDIDTKKSSVAMVATQEVTINIIEDFSSLRRLFRVVGACLRFANNCKSQERRKFGSMTVAELKCAQHACIRLAQAAAFPEEVKQLSSKQTISSKSPLISFTPFLDENGILRIGGRIEQSALAYQQKHQWILPSKGNFTKLVIEEAHIRAQHGGALLVMNILRNQYWIISARNAVKGVIHRCVTCHRYRKSTHNQIMGSIPKVRITEAPPFKNVAIDYAGPINIKASKLRTNKTYKAWIALFVCMCTKAVHIELVTDLTTAAYLAAFTRFSSRRGLPTDIYSDNAKTFVGADKELARQFNSMLKESAIPDALANLGTQWHFIPPRSPHFGGLWEAGIKCMKKHLHRVLGVTMLTYEEMTTVLSAIEANMNSRPLTPMTEDVNDFTALTPGHFLIGRELVTTPSENFSDVASNKLTKWKLLKKLQQDFWRRWRKEYLCGLQQRNKWVSTKKDTRVGDMVLLKEDNVPPSHWTLCRVVDVHPGSDDRVRVVTLNTPSGNLKRAIAKICPLPMEQ